MLLTETSGDFVLVIFGDRTGDLQAVLASGPDIPPELQATSALALQALVYILQSLCPHPPYVIMYSSHPRATTSSTLERTCVQCELSCFSYVNDEIH